MRRERCITLALGVLLCFPLLATPETKDPSFSEAWSTLTEVADNYPTQIPQDQRAEIERLWNFAESGLLATLESKTAPEGDVELLLGEIYRMGHNLNIPGAREKAVAHLRKACDLKPADPKPRFSLGRHLTFSGDFTGGELALLQAYLLTAPDKVTDLLYMLAHNYYFQKRFALVVELAERFPKDHAGAPQVLFLRDSAREAMETGKVPKILATSFDLLGSHPPLALTGFALRLEYEEPPFARYYSNPRPDTIPALIEDLRKRGSLSSGKKTAAGFLSQVFRDNPDRLPQWAPAIWRLEDPARDYVWRAVWLAGTAPATELLREAERKEKGAVLESLASYAGKPATPLLDLAAASGPDLDTFWGAFFATGKPEYLAKIVDALPLFLQNPQENLPAFSVGATAEWSLRENASRDPRVLAICKSERDRRTGDARHLLARLIRQAERR